MRRKSGLLLYKVRFEAQVCVNQYLTNVNSLTRDRPSELTSYDVHVRYMSSPVRRLSSVCLTVVCL